MLIVGLEPACGTFMKTKVYLKIMFKEVTNEKQGLSGRW
jgi:hypothetical protein